MLEVSIVLMQNLALLMCVLHHMSTHTWRHTYIHTGVSTHTHTHTFIIPCPQLTQRRLCESPRGTSSKHRSQGRSGVWKSVGDDQYFPSRSQHGARRCGHQRQALLCPPSSNPLYCSPRLDPGHLPAGRGASPWQPPLRRPSRGSLRLLLGSAPGVPPYSSPTSSRLQTDLTETELSGP